MCDLIGQRRALANRHAEHAWHRTLYIGVDRNGDVIIIDVGPDTVDTIRNGISDLVRVHVEPTASVLESDDDFCRGDSRPVNRSLFDLFTLASLTEQSGHEAFHIRTPV